jgi:hypothetical protein
MHAIYLRFPFMLAYGERIQYSCRQQTEAFISKGQHRCSIVVLMQYEMKRNFTTCSAKKKKKKKTLCRKKPLVRALYVFSLPCMAEVSGGNLPLCVLSVGAIQECGNSRSHTTLLALKGY